MATIVKKPQNTRKPWVVRYQHEGFQRERGFRYKKDAEDYLAKFEHDSRLNLFVDPTKGNERFRDAAEAWIERHPGAARTKAIYRGVGRNHVFPAIGDKLLRQLANDVDAVQELLTVTMPAKGLGASWISSAYRLITAVMNSAVKSGKIANHRLNGIELKPVKASADDFVFPDHAELAKMVAEMPAPYALTIWLMRGCGLRIGEALAVKVSDFTNGHLRIRQQMLTKGNYGPLKHRDASSYRDVPVPGYVARMAAEAVPGPGGYLFAPVDRRTYARWFNAARDKAGIPASFTPHSLRHCFASVALRHGIPITDVATWLGHSSVNTTFSIYKHFLPDTFDAARTVLDQEYQTWASKS